MNISLKNKTALVCGSTQGIGKAVAMELASLGARVILFARDEKKLRLAMKELDHSGKQRHGFLCADFSNPGEVKKAVSAFVKKNAVHILVNNTGGPKYGTVTEAQPEEFLNAFRQHLICNQVLVQAVLAGMKKGGYGRIINIISTSVKEPISGLGVSNTIRAAVANWSKTLAGELAPVGITVNNVLPGTTETARLSSLIESKMKNTGTSREEVIRKMKSRIPMGRFADPAEIAAAIGFLASPSASYITGINFAVDGGRTGSL